MNLFTPLFLFSHYTQSTQRTLHDTVYVNAQNKVLFSTEAPRAQETLQIMSKTLCKCESSLIT